MRKLLFITTVIFFLGGCDSPIVGTFSDLFKIRAKVQKIITTGDIAVNINNGAYLSISIINSALNNKTSGDRKTTAEKVAAIAYKNYADREHLKEVFVVFASHERKYLIVDYNSTIETFSYLAEKLKDKQTDSQASHQFRNTISDSK